MQDEGQDGRRNGAAGSGNVYRALLLIAPLLALAVWWLVAVSLIPILSSMETVHLGNVRDDVPVYFDRNAYQADAVIPIGRVKPHTDFHDRYESGLVKMAVIGLGKAAQAEEMHPGRPPGRPPGPARASPRLRSGAGSPGRCPSDGPS